MARRDEYILDVLSQYPWWVSVCLSAAAYVGLRFVVPLFIPAGPPTSSNFVTKGFLGGLSAGAPLVAIVLLLSAPLAAIRQWQQSRLLDKQEGLTSVRSLSWPLFETLVGEAYRRQGYSVSRPSGNGLDGGVDLVLVKDGNTLLVLYKQWHVWEVGAKVIRELYDVMTGKKTDGAIVITSGTFTQEAGAFAEGKPIHLVGGEQLATLIRSVQGVPKSAPVAAAVQAAPLGPAAPAGSTQKLCPQCGQPMALRTAQPSSKADQRF